MLNNMLQNLQGLQGLQANKVKLDAFQSGQVNRQKAADLLRSYQETQDPSKLNEAILLDADLANNVLAGIDLTNKAAAQREAEDFINIRAIIDDDTKFGPWATKRVDEMLANRQDPSRLLGLIQTRQKEGLDAAKVGLNAYGAALVNKGVLRPEIFTGGVAAEAPTSQQEFAYYQKLLATNPELAKQYGMSKGYIQTGKEQAKTEKQKDLETYKSLKAQGSPDAESFGRAAGFLTKEGQQLSATSEKALLDSAEQVDFNSTNVTKYLDLANRFKASDISGGILGTGGSWREAAKTALGSQDEVSKMVGDWTKIRSGEAIASLPQGPATDADIRLALKPLPENANAEYMDKYLRGLAKVAAYKAAYSQFKSDFISDNGSLRAKDGTNFGKAWAEQRESVLKGISEDPRFTVTEQQTEQVSPQGAITIGNYQVVEVK